MDRDGMPTKEEIQEMLLELKALDEVAKENCEFVCEFIELYHEFTCLWKYSCQDYRNRHAKNRAYDALVAKMKEIDLRADRNSVIRKINSLRTAFRREYRKVRQSLLISETVPGRSKKYSPSLWYYDLLKFVVEQQDNVPPPGIALSEWQEDRIDASYEEFDEKGKEQNNDVNVPEPSIKLEPLSPSSPSRGCSSTSEPTATSTSGPMLNLEINSIYLKEYPTTNINTLQESALKKPRFEAIPSDHDRFGVYVATKLKKSSPKKIIIAEKVIAEVLMRANLGTLDETTTLTEAIPIEHQLDDAEKGSTKVISD